MDEPNPARKSISSDIVIASFRPRESAMDPQMPHPKIIPKIMYYIKHILDCRFFHI